MRVTLEVIVWIFIVICLAMLVHYAINIHITHKYLKGKKISSEILQEKVNMIVVLPCLREQNVIAGSIEYFYGMSTKNANIYLLIACTKRELETNKKYGFNTTSAEVAKEFIKSNKSKNGAQAFVYEAEDFEKVDRATQMNYAVAPFFSENPKKKTILFALFALIQGLLLKRLMRLLLNSKKIHPFLINSQTNILVLRIAYGKTIEIF